MAEIVRMPKLGLTMTEGTIVKWLKKEGEEVKQGEPLLEIQTDKVNLEEEAPASGILRKILAPEGSVVAVGQEIAIIGAETEPLPEIGKNTGVEVKQAGVEPERPAPAPPPSEKVKASPAAKRVAREYGIDLKSVTPTGPDGRVVERDVLEYIESRKVKATPVARKIAEEKGVDLSRIGKLEGERITKQDVLEALKLASVEPREEYRVIPWAGMRKIISDKMVKTKAQVPHFYLTLEVDMGKALELREKLAPKIQELNGVKLSINDILIKAAARALVEHPLVNSSAGEEGIVVKNRINIGLAVALDDGLIVPVIRDADKKGLVQISKETAELIKKAREGKLMPDDYLDGTFTISNLGMFDIEEFSAIINAPESAILAVGKIVKKPVVVEDEIVVRPMMKLTLSCDHRVIDGALGAKFLRRIKQLLEDPVEMLL
ncbi:dihydrolipoamide acetyltransferase family protein [Thermosediminibacter oceani]|uniref:Dihydrolipoamide acetyltransferase component of pyruvate dehydrogenase complex n=1 Tax=Thermosediminibacter oceani (strain ATCC BAA-1034 / DSM 16646 / JW/IW-1228P) TaxID=555079 RepID=D9RXV9_THEOJ|nr:dihydrolipoamide acetyltransferase family protein [Thermosediminibacter oceani]ADL08183.1 catalytic domain of components of various dehydrogenase complexes [Thermosediminibacter oceani DSM 16646]